MSSTRPSDLEDSAHSAPPIHYVSDFFSGYVLFVLSSQRMHKRTPLLEVQAKAVQAKKVQIRADEVPQPHRGPTIGVVHPSRTSDPQLLACSMKHSALVVTFARRRAR